MLALSAITKGPAPISLLLIAIAFAAWFGGARPALFSTAVAVLCAQYFVANEVVYLAPWADEIRVAIMAVVGTCISLLAGSLHSARASQRMEAARLDSFIEHVPAGVIVFDAKGNVVRN